MKRGLNHPLWVHTPTLVLLVGYIGYWCVQIDRLPARIPIQFGLHGQPISYGSPWLLFGVTVFLSVLFIALSGVMEELWVRQERQKRFNPLVLLDDLTVGALVGFQVGYLQAIIDGRMDVPFHWAYGAGFIGAAVAAGVLLERLRPFIGITAESAIESTEELRREVAERLARGERILYWDVQNPRYVSFLSLIVPVVLWVGAGLQLGTNVWVAGLLFIVGVLLLLFYGGQRTLVTQKQIRVRYGVLGITVLRLDVSAIRDVNALRFSPLQDFGGYGIRRNRKMTAYYLGGDHGVVLTTDKGRKILIGSNASDRLAAIIEVIAGFPRRKEAREEA